MKVALVVERMEIGGLPNYVLALARLLAEAGSEVVVVHGNTPLPAHLEVTGVVTRHVPGLLSGADGDAAAELLALAPDVIHVHHCGAAGVISRLLASGVPLVRSFHDLTTLCLRLGRRRWSGDRCQRALHWRCVGWGCMISPPRNGGLLPHVADVGAKLRERDTYRHCGVSIACSTFMAHTLRLNGFDEERIHLVPNFSRFDSFATGALPPRRRGIPGGDRPFELLFSGQAVGGKGLEVLIAALRSTEGNWRLTVLGEGPRLAPARSETERFGLQDRVRFAGWVPQAETARYYQLSDLLVIPSIIDEALPLVGIEAMSFGTPLVGFAVGGIPDYLRDDETGVLVETTTAEALRVGMQRAMGDPDRITAWGREARSLVARRHTRGAHLTAIQQAYRAAGCRVGVRSAEQATFAQVMT
jgi:glycosyltransferase involved in cell wall biosynthesis